MSYKYSKLLGRMREYGFTQAGLAAEIGCTTPILNRKLKNKSAFKQNEIISICNALSINTEEIGLYFFTN